MSAPQTFAPVEEQMALLSRGTAEIIPEPELRAKLEASRKSGKPLRVKLGVDPTAPDLHLGHTVVLRKLRHFQQLGHTAIFLVGDFTAMVGDPTGQSETRPPLTAEQVQSNVQTYLTQVYKILDPEKTEIRYNAEWLGKLTSYEMVRLCGHYRLARMLEREDFRNRLDKNLPISVHELLYPLLVAYDSVMLEADVELGASEQKFNLLTGRDMQREFNQPLQVAMTMPILVGTDGQRKMSKSLGNYVGITEAPSQMFGKIMSISDEVMWSYYELVTDFASPVIVRLREEVRTGVLPPIDAKMQLAHTIIANFHGEDAGRAASDEFRRVFRERQAPTEVPNHTVPAGTYKLLQLLTQIGLAGSRSDAERLVRGNAVEIDGQAIDQMNHSVALKAGESIVLRAGKKKFARVVAN